MSQSSVAEQVKELASAGFPVSRGARTIARDGKIGAEQYGSDLWFSRWSLNAFRNYPIVSKCFGIRFLADSCHGMPAFVVGVGPSLDAQIKDLKLAKNRALVISTDAALRALLATGVTPDLVLSYDCKNDQKRLWSDVPKDLLQIPCLFNSTSHPDSIAAWPGPILFFNQYHTQDDLCHRILPTVFPELGQIPSAGTVGTMAILAAHAMGCAPICAVGMDFCYKDSQYRAQDYKFAPSPAPGIPEGWALTEIKELYDNQERVDRSFIVKGEDGREFRTDPELTFYLKSFKDLMPHFKIPLVNCSPDGMIPSSGAEKMEGGPEVIHLYEKLSVSEAIGKFCKSEYQQGRTVLKHLAKIAPDPRNS